MTLVDGLPIYPGNWDRLMDFLAVAHNTDGTINVVGGGVTGPAGATGAAGSVWYVGSAVPSTLHTDGDFYLRTTNGEVYEQVAGVWVDQGFSLIGPTGTTGATGSAGPAGAAGATGAAGAAWYTGGSVPGTLHNNGDFYLRTSTGEVYKQVAGVWVDQGITLVGPAGSTGATGATGATGPSGTAAAGMQIATDSPFNFVAGDVTGNDAAMTAYLAGVAAGTYSPVLWFPAGIYKFTDTVNFNVSGVEFIRLLGMGGGPLYNQSYGTYGKYATIFNFTKASASTFLNFVSTIGTVQSGFTLEYISLNNSGHASNVAIEIDQYNNWELHRLGWQGWGTGILSRSNTDNAHGFVYRPIMNVPAGKIGIDVPGLTGGPGTGGGFNVCGGSISGTSGAIGLRGGEYSAGMTLSDQVKFDGCTGGAVVWAGNALESFGTHIERCSDATHAAVQFKTGSVAVSGNANAWWGGTIVGGAAVGEVPFSAEVGAEGNYIAGVNYQNFNGGDPYLGTVIAGKFGSQYGVNEAAIVSYASGKLGFYGTTPAVKQTGVAVSAAGVHAALVNLGLIAA